MNGDKNYDVEVTQIPTASNDSTEYSLLLKHSDSSSTETDTVNTTRNARFTYKPSTNTLNASYYDGNALVRKSLYGSAGFRTQGGDSLNRSVNAEYLQEGFNVKYTPTYSGGDLTSAGIDFQINEYGGYGHQPNLEIYNTRYASDSQDSGVNREGVIDHESIKVYEDHFNDNYASLSSQYKGFQADKDNIYLIHQEWSQGSATPTINEVMQIKIDDITLTGNTWDSTNTSLTTAVTNAKSKVKQENTTTDSSYRLLLSHDANDTTTDNVTTQKSTYLQFNPNKSALTVGTRGTGTVGTYSFTSGYGNVAGQYSQAEGLSTKSTGTASHTEGFGTTASGNYSHSEGSSTTAVGSYSHSEGLGTYATSKSQHVFGEYNTKDGSDNKTGRNTYVEIVGNGTADNARSDARRLSWNGNEWLAGSLTTTDVVKEGTWDGTHTSLSDTISAIAVSDNIPLFENGEWKNQNICGITTNKGTISNGVLAFSGENAGFNVTDVSGLTNYLSYSIKFKMTSTNGVDIQAGRSGVNGTISGIINQGTDRYSYTNDTVPSGDITIELMASINTEGVFFAGGYRKSNINYSVSEIRLINQSIRTYY